MQNIPGQPFGLRLPAATLRTSVSVLALALGTSHALAVDITTAVVGDVDITDNGNHIIRGSGSVSSTAHGDNELVLITPDPFNGDFANNGVVALEGFTGVRGVGLAIGGTVEGNVTNNGKISVNHTTAGTMSFATGVAVDIGGDINGSLLNRGRIEIGGVSDKTSLYSEGVNVNDIAGTLENRGVISISPMGASSQISAFGVDSGNILTGGILENSGTIAIDLSGASFAYGYGLDVSDNDGVLRNSGVIDIQLSGGSSASGEAMSTRFNRGLVENSGTIKVTADGSSYGYATGVHAFSQSGTGHTANIGTIDVSAKGGTNATANGIHIAFAGGTIENSGTISASASASASAYAYGVNAGSGFPFANGASVLNTGTITAAAQSSFSTAEAIGVRAQEVGSDQSVVNNGTVTAEASGGAVEAFGLEVRFVSGTEGSLTNTGKITARANGNGSSSVEAVGIQMSGNARGTIENSGTIIVESTQIGTSENFAAGLNHQGTVDGTFRNSGTVSVNAFDGSGDAYGILVNSIGFSGTLENTGTLLVSASGEQQGVYGIDVFGARGTLVHSGTIVAKGTNGVDQVTGLSWNSVAPAAHLLVTGDIAATGGDVSNVALDARGTAGSTVEIESTATLVGDILVSDSNVILRSVGASATYQFTDSAPGTGAFTTEVGANGQNWFIQGEGTANPIYATLAGGEIGGNPNVMADAVGLLDIQAASIGTGNALTPQVTRGAGGAFGIDESQGRYFQLQVGAVHGGTDGLGNDVSSGLLGVSGGFIGTTESGNDLSFGGGVFVASGRSGETDFDTFGAFLGRTVASDLGGLRFSRGFGGGVMVTEQARNSAGATTAHSDFVSAFVTGHLGFESRSNLGVMPFKPFGSIRYTHFFSEGYTETGGAANATVGSRDFGVADLKLGGKLQDMEAGQGLLSASFALAYRGVFGGDQDVSVFGQPGTAAFADTNRLGTEISVQYSQPFRAGNLELGANLGSFGSGGASLTATARYSIKF